MVYIMALTIAMSVLAVLALVLTIKNTIEIKAMQKSTHTIQYVDSDLDKLNEEYLKQQSDAVEKYNKEYSNELKEEMPAFASEDDDKKVRAL